jgi:glyoxylase-like metal-dependent hydrolase (beta-lactamase superfamily II)
MQVTEHIHALKIPFKIPVSPEKQIDRVVYSFIIFGVTITLIDSGVAGSESLIFDYIQEIGRTPQEISTLILSHSHPDHIGAAKTIKEITGCVIAAHHGEKAWIEDTAKQFAERPVPGFQSLVTGPVPVDMQLEDSKSMQLQKDISCKILHTPGHSSGSISLYFNEEKTLFTGDALPFPGDLPIYDDIAGCTASIRKLCAIDDIGTLLSSWESPIIGHEAIHERMRKGLAYLKNIHATVLETAPETQDPMVLCKKVVEKLGLPPFAANPLVAKAFASSLAAGSVKSLFG